MAKKSRELSGLLADQREAVAQAREQTLTTVLGLQQRQAEGDGVNMPPHMHEAASEAMEAAASLVDLLGLGAVPDLLPHVTKLVERLKKLDAVLPRSACM